MKILLVLSLCLGILEAKHIHKEKYYQRVFCNKMNGITEVRLKDKTRVDCSTNTFAIEVDFANKWAESIGQSLYYSLMTKKSPGILIILERPKKEIVYLRRLKKVADRFNIQVWSIDKSLKIQKH